MGVLLVYVYIRRKFRSQTSDNMDEAHFWRVRSTFGSWDVEKVHAVVARSTFPSQNVQNTSALVHFWKLRCWKKAYAVKASKSKMYKTPQPQSIFGSSDVEKVHAVVAQSKFPSQNVKKRGPVLKVQMSFRVAGARDCAPCQSERIVRVL